MKNTVANVRHQQTNVRVDDHFVPVDVWQPEGGEIKGNVVLAPGFMERGSYFEQTGQAIASAGYNVIVPTHPPDNSENYKLSESRRVRNILGLLTHIKQEQGVDEWIVMGHSMGAGDALRVTQLATDSELPSVHIDRVELLAPIGTNGKRMFASLINSLFQPSIVKRYFEELYELVPESPQNPLIKQMKLGNLALQTFWNYALNPMMVARDYGFADGADIRPQIAVVRAGGTPCTVHHGEMDPIAPPPDEPGEFDIVYDGFGHFWPLTEPKTMGKIVQHGESKLRHSTQRT